MNTSQLIEMTLEKFYNMLVLNAVLTSILILVGIYLGFVLSTIRNRMTYFFEQDNDV